MDFNRIPGKRSFYDQSAPYQAPSDHFFGRSHHGAKPRIPAFLSNAVQPNHTSSWQNTPPTTRHIGVQPPHGGTYAAAPPSAHDSANDQYSAYGRTDSALHANGAALSLPSEVVHDQGVHSQFDDTFIPLSDGTALNDSQQTSVPITVSSFAATQLYVEARNGLPGAYTDEEYSPIHASRGGPNSQIENVSYNVFDDYAMPDVAIHDASGQPQRIDVNHGDYPMDNFDYTQNQAEPFAFEMGNNADYSVSTQNSPAVEWVQNQQPMGTLDSSQDIGPRRQSDNTSGHLSMKRKRSDSPEAGSSDVQSPVKSESPTRHTQPRPIVGSPATRLAGEKRRRTEATFVCDHCGNTFTRNHNRLNHIRTHFGKAGTQCPRVGCGKSLAKTSLSRHLKNCRGS